MNVKRAVIGVLALALLPGCSAGQTGGQVCATVGATVIAGTPNELIPPPGYAFVDVDAAAARGVPLGGIAKASAESFKRYVDHDLPGVVTGLSVLDVVIGDTRVGAVRRVCTSTPMVLRIFQVNPEVAPALNFWKIEITGFSGMTFAESDSIYDNQDVAWATGMLSGKRGQQYLWLHDNALFWVYGQDSQATASFAEAALAEERS